MAPTAPALSDHLQVWNKHGGGRGTGRLCSCLPVDGGAGRKYETDCQDGKGLPYVSLG